MRAVLISGAVLAGVLTGCEVGPNYRAPHPDVAGQFGEVTPAGTETQPSKVTFAEPVAEWWKTLNDATLDDLIQRAVAGNLDLQIATMRIREARAQRGIVAADLFPEVDATGGYAHARGSKNVELPLGGAGGSGGAGAASAGGSGGSGRRQLRDRDLRALSPQRESAGGGSRGQGEVRLVPGPAAAWIAGATRSIM